MGIYPCTVERVAFSRPVPTPGPNCVARYRARANRLGPLPAFSTPEVLMHSDDDESSVDTVDVDLTISTTAAVQ